MITSPSLVIILKLVNINKLNLNFTDKFFFIICDLKECSYIMFISKIQDLIIE